MNDAISKSLVLSNIDTLVCEIEKDLEQLYEDRDEAIEKKLHLRTDCNLEIAVAEAKKEVLNELFKNLFSHL